jgi:hypothetical protein
MTVAELIAALERCDPGAIVLIPAAPALGEASEPVMDLTCVEAGRLSSGRAAQYGAVRLSGFPFLLMVSSSDGPEI